MSRPHTLTTQSDTDWIKWAGGKCPEHPDTLVRPWLKDIGEAKHDIEAGKLDWGKRLLEGARLPGSVLGYRVIHE